LKPWRRRERLKEKGCSRVIEEEIGPGAIAVLFLKSRGLGPTRIGHVQSTHKLKLSPSPRKGPKARKEAKKKSNDEFAN
jgi:hypothetical protein